MSVVAVIVIQIPEDLVDINVFVDIDVVVFDGIEIFRETELSSQISRM